ncbi:MAG: hypothetical protein OEZ38_14040 [Gammaproteobacteria bacterium]|nr:hypothetical protein [Gammaproteobacteria bacterium]
MSTPDQQITKLEQDSETLHTRIDDLLDLTQRMSQELQEFLDDAEKEGKTLHGTQMLIAECDKLHQQYFSNDTAANTETPGTDCHYFIKQAL